MKLAKIRREMEDLRQNVQHEATPLRPPPAADDAGPLAAELAASFGARVKAYQETLGLSPADAAARAGAADAARDDRVLRCPPDQVQWHELNRLALRDPDLARRRWEEVKQAARDELLSGYRAGRVMECPSDPWGRARFLALRDELAGGLRPRNGFEGQLIEMLAQAQTMLFWWQENLTALTRLAALNCRPALEGKQPYEPPRVSEAEHLQRTTAMVERWHGIYLRTLKALRDQRRGSPQVVVRRASQVNVAEQQVNIAGA